MRIISGEYGRRRFDVPRNITARPTTDMARENLFNVLSGLTDFDGIDALDLFGGTGAITFELLSRGAASVTTIEKASVQTTFIARVARELGCSDRLRLIRGDVFKFLASLPPAPAFDLIFADPPYDLPRFAEVPRLVLDAGILRPGGIFVIEHSRAYDFSGLPGFADHRAYGSVNFTILRRETAD